MFKKLTKLIFLIITFLILILIISPILFDKKKIVLLINEKVKKEFNFDVNFDEEINISFFPFPEVKLKDVIIKDTNKGFDVKIIEMEIASTWKSIARLDPEIKSIRLNSPVFKFENNILSKNEIIFVTNIQNQNFESIKPFLNKFKSIEVKNGKFDFFHLNKKNNLDNIEFFYKNSIKNKINLDFNYLNYRSFFKIKAETIDFEEIFFDINQQFENKNEIFGTGVLSTKDKKINLSGKLQSENLDFIQITKLISQLRIYKNNNFYKANIGAPILNFNIGFSVDKVSFNEFEMTNFESKIFSKKENIIFDGLRAKHKDSLIKVDAIYFKNNKLIKGKMLILDYMLKKNLIDKSEFYLDNALFDCDIDFSLKNKKAEKKFLNNLLASGDCNAPNSDLVGININKIISGIDNLETFQDFFDLFNKEKMKGITKVDSINLKFDVKNSILNIIEMTAKQKNMKVRSTGSFKLYSEELDLINNIFVKTKKFKDLPNFDLIIRGTPKDYKITYNFDKIKSAVLSGGINSILKKKKKIVINPKSLKGLIDKESKKINTEKLFDLFLD